MPRFVRPRVQDINLTHKPPLFMQVLTIPASKCIFRVGRITQGGALTPYGIIINRHAKARQHPRSHMHKPTNLDIRPTYPVNSVPYLAPRPEDCAARLAVLMEDPDVAKFCESLSAALEAADIVALAEEAAVLATRGITDLEMARKRRDEQNAADAARRAADRTAPTDWTRINKTAEGETIAAAGDSAAKRERSSRLTASSKIAETTRGHRRHARSSSAMRSATATLSAALGARRFF